MKGYVDGWQDGLLTTSTAGNGDEGWDGCTRRKLVGCNNSVLTSKHLVFHNVPPFNRLKGIELKYL